MDWEDIGKAAGKFFLILIEYSFKICATAAAIITLAAPGSFSAKLSAGFGSLSMALRKLVNAPSSLMEMGRMINDYNTQAAATFNETYGAEAVSGLLYKLNAGIEYFVSVYGNITGSPFSTIFSTLLVFLAFYVLAWVLRFARQKGKGSFLVQMERALGDKIFKRNKKPVTPTNISNVSRRERPKPPRSNFRSRASTTRARVSNPHVYSTKTSSKNPTQGRSAGPDSNPGFSASGSAHPDSQSLAYLLEAARSS